MHIGMLSPDKPGSAALENLPPLPSPRAASRSFVLENNTQIDTVLLALRANSVIYL